MTSLTQTAVNAAATRWLAEHLEQPIGDPTAAAERIVKELLAMGLKPVPRPVPLRPAVVASDAVRNRALQQCRTAVADARARRTTVEIAEETT